MVDLHNLPERAQRFVVGVVLAAGTARKELGHKATVVRYPGGNHGRGCLAQVGRQSFLRREAR